MHPACAAVMKKCEGTYKRQLKTVWRKTMKNDLKLKMVQGKSPEGTGRLGGEKPSYKMGLRTNHKTQVGTGRIRKHPQSERPNFHVLEFGLATLPLNISVFWGQPETPEKLRADSDRSIAGENQRGTVRSKG